MAPKSGRLDRLLERQRGAATRQVKNIGFNLVLPGQEDAADAPLQPRKSGRSRKTPQPDILPPQRSSRRTPAPGLLPQRSSRRTPAPEALAAQPSSRRTPKPDDLLPQQSSRRAPTSTASKKRGHPAKDNGDEGIATKKRKVKTQSGSTLEREAESQGQALQPKDPKQSVVPVEGVKKRRKRKSIGQQSMKKSKAKASPAETSTTTKVGPTVEVSPVSADELNDKIQEQLRREAEEHDNVEDVPETQLPGSISERNNASRAEDTGQKKAKKRKRVSDGQESEKQAKTQASIAAKDELARNEATLDNLDAEQEPDPDEERGRSRVPKSATKNRREPIASPQIQTEQPELPTSITIPRPSPVANPQLQPEQLKPRRKKRKSIGQQKVKRTSISTLTPRKPVAAISTKSVAKKKPSRKRKPKAPSGRPRGRPAKTSKPAEHDTKDSDDADAPEGSSESLLPNHPLKRGRPKTSAKSQTGTSDSIKPHSNPKSTQPKAHKTLSAKSKPTGTSVPIIIYRPPSPSSSDPDLITKLPNTFNPIDVLAQVTRERLSKILSKPNPPKTQKIHKLYRTELEERLLLLTRAKDMNTSLNAQVKKAVGEEKGLKQELKDLEAERKRVQERRNEIEGEMKSRELEALLGKIAGVVSKGWAREGKEVEES